MSRASAIYTPLDALLEQPRVRVLRALRWLDWVTVIELCNVVDDRENATVQSFWRALVKLSAAGHVERDAARATHRYRITAGGRCELKRLLSSAVVHERMVRA